MRLLRRCLRVVAAGAGVVAVGVAVNQVLNGGRWNLRWLVAAVVLAVLSEGFDLWLGTHEGDNGPAIRPGPFCGRGLADEDGTPLLLSEVTLRDLGHMSPGSAPKGTLPYVRRQADDLLAATLADRGKRLVIVEGPRLTGATRTMAQAAQACLLTIWRQVSSTIRGSRWRT